MTWLADVPADRFDEIGPWQAAQFDAPPVERVSPDRLAAWLADGAATVIDMAPSAQHVKGHIPAEWWALRSQLRSALDRLPAISRLVVTGGDDALPAFAAADLRSLVDETGVAARRRQRRVAAAGPAARDR